MKKTAMNNTPAWRDRKAIKKIKPDPDAYYNMLLRIGFPKDRVNKMKRQLKPQ